jgi:hypothetical protein
MNAARFAQVGEWTLPFGSEQAYLFSRASPAISADP